VFSAAIVAPFESQGQKADSALDLSTEVLYEGRHRIRPLLYSNATFVEKVALLVLTRGLRAGENVGGTPELSRRRPLAGSV
jgi:hypothetical protein